MKNRKFSYSQITDRFLKFEERNRLLSLSIGNVYLWEVCRTTLFFTIIDHFYPSNPTSYRLGKWRKIKSTLHRVFINSVFFNPFFSYKKVDVFIFESGRKYWDNNKLIDIYTYYLDKKFGEQNISFRRFEVNYNVDEGFFRREFDVKHLDFIFLLSKILRLRRFQYFSEVELVEIERIKQGINDEFGVELDLHAMFWDELRRFRTEVSLFCRLFKKSKPKELYLVNSCDKPALVAAAKENGIIVNELQHGLNSNHDIVLNFPYCSKDDLHYFPHNFYKWNNVHMFFATLPLASNNIKYIKNYHIDHWLEKTKSIAKEMNTVLVLSQPYGAQDIYDFIIKNMKGMEAFNFIYKIHPAENSNKYMDFNMSTRESTNLVFVNNQESLYPLLKKAKYVIGVYSSALFEAVVFDCKIIVLDLPGGEMSQPLLNNMCNRLMSVDENLIDYILEDQK